MRKHARAVIRPSFRRGHVEGSALTSHRATTCLAAGVLSASTNCSGAGLVSKSCLASRLELLLIDPAVLEDLEDQSEQDEAEVGVANQFPAEAVEEGNFVVDDGRRAHLLAEGARAVIDVVIAVQCVIVGSHICLARHG